MKGHAMEIWVGLGAIVATIAIGLMALWATGNETRKKLLHEKVESYNKATNKRIDKCQGDHVHKELCDERSGEIKEDIRDHDHKIERLQTR